MNTKVDLHTVDRLDLARYMGKWYEIARYNHRFEKSMTNVTAEYTLLPDGKIKVVNAGYINNLPDRHKTIEGKGKLPDPKEPGKLKVSFFLWFYTDYYVLDLDQKNYSYALVGSSTPNYLWILSRTPRLPEDIKIKLIEEIKTRGLAPEKLIWSHSNQAPRPVS